MKRAVVGALLALGLMAVPACKDTPSPPARPRSVRDSVRVGVWMSPDPSGSTYGAAATRSLIYPQLFRARPDGRWAPGVVDPGSDQTGRKAKTARFRLRANAKWSDGTPITAADLRRTMDKRFVLAVDDPTRHGAIVVRFTQPLPEWRRLWSGLEVISPPKDEVFGGPYRLARQTPNLEAVLTRNDGYYGKRALIRQVHLVFVPDSEIAARLMERGELDVLAPPAFSARTARLRRVKNTHVMVGSAERGGWTAALIANPSRLTKEQRVALFALVDRQRFTDVLLHGEAASAGASTASVVAAPTGGVSLAIGAPVEEPQIGLLLQAMQRLGRDRGVTIELRQASFDQVLGAFAASDFDALLRLQPTTPSRCWICEAASVNPTLAAAADAGQPNAAAHIDQQLFDDALVLPLWRERPVVAARNGLLGVGANGFSAAGPAWNLETWRWNA